MSIRYLAVLCVFASIPCGLVGGDHFVDVASTSSVPPYATWSTAATVIQDAIDAALAGDTVWVTNGTYASGGRPVPGSALTNRVVVTNDITLRSINGPEFTVIQGVGPRGATAVRCLYMSTGTVRGFTVTNGYTAGWDAVTADQDGGGAYALDGFLTNCVITECDAERYGGGAYGGVLVGCALYRNRTQVLGGGAKDSVLTNCVLYSNTAMIGGGGAADCAMDGCLILCNGANEGGGASGGILSNCTLSANTGNLGGGASFSRLSGCLLLQNLAHAEGGGAYRCIMNDSVVSNNAVLSDFSGIGGGVSLGTLTNCLLVGNTVLAEPGNGGGASGGRLVNCTVCGNHASHEGGGAFLSELQNSIVHGNVSEIGERNDVYGGTASYSCTHPDSDGIGNITNDPQLTPTFRLRSTSPCIDAGTTNGAPATDSDGEARWDHPGHSNAVSTVDMGWDEFVDRDLDAMADFWEIETFGQTNRDGTADADDDDLSDLDEYENGTSGNDPDSDGDAMSDGWEVARMLEPLVNDAALNPDADGYDNVSEFIADTDPHDSNSVLRITSVNRETGGTRLDWQGGVDSWQWLEWKTNLTDVNAWEWIAAFPPPTPRTHAVVIIGATNTPAFYRIRAERQGD